MNDLRRLENLEKQINSMDDQLKRMNPESSLYNIFKTKLQKINEEANKLKRYLDVSIVQNTITTFDGLDEIFELFPENKRRTINKIIHRSDYFHLVYNINDQRILIQKKNEIIYSTIPYDTCRIYIQRAAILTLLYPNQTKKYLKKHKRNLMTYIKKSLRQVKKPQTLAKKYYNEIFVQPLFMIQILGRMLQHDETGPLSANLPGKF